MRQKCQGVHELYDKLLKVNTFCRKTKQVWKGSPRDKRDAAKPFAGKNGCLSSLKVQSLFVNILIRRDIILAERIELCASSGLLLEEQITG